MSDKDLPKKSEKTLILDKDEDRWRYTGYKLPNVGERISNYEILEVLGKGGFGAVFKVKNQNLGREEALKMVLPSAKASIADSQKRFSREVDLVSRLEHPNIVRLYNFGELDENVLWMTMEYVEGIRLDDKLKEKRKLPFAQVRRYMLQMLSGLMEAHKRMIVHRDIKPANILITNKEGYEDQVVILDFGLAKGLGTQEDAAVQELTCVDDTNRIYGTPEYMAPEQLNQGNVGAWSDVYAAGLLFYEMLTGTPAVTGTSLFDIAYKQAFSPLDIPEKYKGTATETLLKCACDKDYKNRYPSAKKFFEAFQRLNSPTDPPDVLDDYSNEQRTDFSLPSLTPVSVNDESTHINMTAYNPSTEIPEQKTCDDALPEKTPTPQNNHAELAEIRRLNRIIQTLNYKNKQLKIIGILLISCAVLAIIAVICIELFAFN